MIAGYALIAYLDNWGSSGVMTFIVNQQRRVCEKDLGPDAAALATAVTEVDADPSSKRIHEPRPRARPPALQDGPPRLASKQQPGLRAILDV